METFTNVRSLLGALAKAMNLINPDMEHHHEQTAYFSFAIASEMKLEEELIHTTIYAALLHDVGAIVVEQRQSVTEIEENARFFSEIGYNMLKDLPDLERVADVIRYCQFSWTDIMKSLKGHEEYTEYAVLSNIIHAADVIATCLRREVPVLNQVNGICEILMAGRGTDFNENVVDALLAIKDREYVWLDGLNNPSFLMFFTGKMHNISLDHTVELTKLMTRIIDYRSSFTAMHSAGVSAAAWKLAKLSGMSNEDCLKMRIAGNLHDIGKLMVPRDILEKPGKLTDEEFNIIREHPYYTRLILMEVEGFEEIANWAGFHHEKLNGKGYPFHFGEEQLDTGSRILAVADIFSAITEERPYRKGMTKEQASKVLLENVERGAVCEKIVKLLLDHYDEVDAVRDQESREAGKMYFQSLERSKKS